ncbi:cysteine-rich small domain-containing protein [Geoglobus ahangari]
MSLRERTLTELFQTLTGIEKGDCEYYPCHFEGQDCSFCFCPFYPCLIHETGGMLKDDRVWSCLRCEFIHKKENAEELKSILSSYPFQVLAEGDWRFYNEILQEFLFGDVRGREIGESYTIYRTDDSEECYLVVLDGFEIRRVERGRCGELRGKRGVLLPVR